MLTNKSLCVVLELCQSYELWHWIICTPVVLALSYLLSLLCSLILSIHFTLRQHFTSSKSGIISCTTRCYQGSRIIGKDKTKTEIWENKPLTQRMLLLHPSAVPHLSRLQPPLGSASWIEGGQWTVRVSHKHFFKKIKSGTHHASAWGLVWTDPKGFLISTKFKAASSHLKFEILPSFRRGRRNVPILNVLLFNLMLRFRATSLKRTCHWPRRL